MPGPINLSPPTLVINSDGTWHGSVGEWGDSSDIFYAVPTTVFFDPNFNTYVERSGDVATLTPASVDGPVGTWVDRSGTRVARAPADDMRMTLRSDGFGRRYLERTANAGQCYVSDEPKGNWKFLHDGSTWCSAVGFKPTLPAPNKLFPLFATHLAAQSAVGAAMYWDDRNSASRFIEAGFTIGGSNTSHAAVNTTFQPGVAGGRWQHLISRCDPDGDSPERLRVYSFGRLSRGNTNTGGVSSADPLHTLHLGALGGATVSADYAAGWFAGFVFYEGDWTNEERTAVADYFDIDNFGLYEELIPPTNISGQVAAYEAFPTLHRSPDGDLIGFWREGASHINVKGNITRAISSDGGLNWTKTRNVVSHSTYDARDFNGLFLPNGDFLGGCNLNDQDITASNAGGLGFLTVRSSDNGLTFTEVSYTTHALVGGVMTATQIAPYGFWHRLADGTILASMFIRQSVSPVSFNAEVWQSTDEGVTWSRRSVIATGSNETVIYNLQGTTWLACIRKDIGGPIMSAVSTDDCLTWSTPINKSLDGVSPMIIRVGDTVYCAIGDRTGPFTGLRNLVWSASRLHGRTGDWLTYETDIARTSSDHGYPAIVVDGRECYQLCFDENDASPGIQFQKYKLPDFGSVL